MAVVTAALAALVGVSGAAADGVVVAGNQNCAELMPGTTELRVDPPKDGTFAAGGLSVTIDVRQLAADDPAHAGDQTGSQVFDFTASGGTVLGVVVKGGTDVNFYSYLPGGTTSGTGLHAPVSGNGSFYDLSHISFCFGSPQSPPPPGPPPPPGSPVIDLAIVKADSPDPVPLGGNVTYALTVTNNGPSTATGVVAADQLPATVNFVSASSTQGTCSAAGGVVTCTLGTIAARATVSVTIVVRPTGTGEICNTATTVGNQPESTTANNSDSECALVQGAFAPPAVCSSLTITPRQLQAGKRSTIVARVRLSNNRPFAGARVRVVAPGVNVTRRANAQGVARISVKPTRPGIARVGVLGSPQCAARTVGVASVFQPPLTG